MMSSLPPFLIFFLAALIAPFLSPWARKGFLLAVPILGAVNMFSFTNGSYYSIEVFEFTLSLVRVDKLSLLFGTIFHLAAFIAILYSLHLSDRENDSAGGHPDIEGPASIQHISGLLYIGSAVGIIFAGDLISLFIFWELMAVTPILLVLARGTDSARNAGMRYLLMQITSGVILLTGIIARYHEVGSLSFDHIGLNGLSGTLILLAFGIKACFPLLHNWAPDAYSEATPTGSVFLSTFTTKTAIYVLARSYAGTEILIYIGAIMAALLIFHALLSNDYRRLLAYSLINQLGIMVCGIGIGTPLALNGAVAHAFASTIYQGLLFMVMGSVMTMTGRVKGSELGGLYKSMPRTAIFCLIGAASISSVPLFSGFATKAMTLSAVIEQEYLYVWLALLFASAGVFIHTGIKLTYGTFFSHDAEIQAEEPPLNMQFAMLIAAFFCILIGCAPGLLYGMLPFAVDYEPFTAAHVLTQYQLLLFAALAFTLLKISGMFPPDTPSINLDAEWTYRRALPRTVHWFIQVFGPLDRWFRNTCIRQIERCINIIFRHHGPEGMMARASSAGNMMLWVTLLLIVFLVLNYL
jgi:multicomponent Na+:H+ antiporter subunit D